MKFKRFLLLLGILLLSGSGTFLLHAEHAKGLQKGGVQVVFLANGSSELPDSLRLALIEYFQSSDPTELETNKYFIIGLRYEGTWGLATYTSTDLTATLPEGEESHIDLNNMANLLFVFDHGQWKVSSDEAIRSSEFLENIPEKDLSDESREALFPNILGSPLQDQTSAQQTPAQQYSNYKFPWTAGNAWRISRTSGWHGGTFSTFIANHALDFDIVGPANGDILASAPGTIRYLCAGSQDQYILGILTQNTTEYLGYMHLDGATVRALSLSIGDSVNQGDKLGRMRYADAGTVSDLCATSYGTHIHIIFPEKPFTMDQKVFSDSNFHVGEDLYSSQGNNCCGCSASLATADSPPLGDELLGPPAPGTDPVVAYDLTAPGDLSIVPSLAEAVENGDSLPPVLSASPNEDYWSSNSTQPALTWPAATDDGTGVAGYRVYWGPDENGIGDIQVSEPAFAAAFPNTGIDAVNYYLRVAPVDNAGNLGLWQTVHVWRYDGQSPSGSMQINGGGSIVPMLPVVLNLSAADEHSGVTAMRFSSDGQTWTEWEPYAAQRNWQLNDTHIAQTIYAQFRDGAGNVSSTVSTSVTADLSLAPPTSANYRIARSVMGIGGGAKSSSTYRLQGTSGQPYQTGLMQSGSYRVASGYWAQSSTPTNQPPNAPSNPSPITNATNVAITSALSWSATDPNNDPLTYAVHFGTSSNPPQVVASQSAATYDPPGNLANGTIYYWKIVASDGKGGETPGPVWSFTTEDAPPQIQTLTLTPIADSYTSANNPTANYGNAVDMRVKEGSLPFYAFLKFDTSALSCAQVQNATLRLYTTSASALSNEVYTAGSNWTETGVNWNNDPAMSGTALDSAATSPLNTWVEYDVKGGVTLGGLLSFGIKGNGGDVVYYSSRQGGQPPQLVIEYTATVGATPTAAFSAAPLSGVAPLAVAFTNASTGCPTTFLWDFGDGATSTEANPVHTYTTPGTYTVSLTAGNGQGSDPEVKSNYITVSDPPAGMNIFFISPSGSATIGGLPSTSADILRYQKSTNTWTMIYDGSVRGTAQNISAFDLLDDGSLLLVFSANQPVAGLGTATPYDVVKFTPNNPNNFPLGAGTYTWFFQGKANGLSVAAEKIDAMHLSGNRLLLSTTGTAKLPLLPSGVLTAADEDVFVYDTVLGRWENTLLIDGSKMTGMAVEDISSVWYDSATYDYYITITGAFNLGGVKGNGKSIIKLTPNGGATVFTSSLVPWLASGATFPSNLDGLDIGQ